MPRIASVISHDTDFGTLLAASRLTKLSFILIRSADPLTADDVAQMLIDNLPTMAPELQGERSSPLPAAGCGHDVSPFVSRPPWHRSHGAAPPTPTMPPGGVAIDRCARNENADLRFRRRR